MRLLMLFGLALAIASAGCVNRQDQLGQLLLDEVSNRNPDRVASLVRQGANVNFASTVSGDTPLIRAVLHDEPKIVRLLLDAGADPTIRNNDGWAALNYAKGPSIKRMLTIEVEKRKEALPRR